MINGKNLLAIGCVVVTLASSGAVAQSAGNLIVTAGPAWFDLGRSSSTPLQSTSAGGTFESTGTTMVSHNLFNPELLLTYFVTDHLAVETVAGVPPRLTLHAHGTATPLGAGGPGLGLDDLQPLATTRAWAPTVLLKYYFRKANEKLRPFVGVGANYTWFSSVQLNPKFASAVGKFGGPDGTVTSKLSPSWNPILSVGASYNLSKNFYAVASVSYLPLKTNGTVSAETKSGQAMLVSTTRFTADPIIAFIGIGYRF